MPWLNASVNIHIFPWSNLASCQMLTCLFLLSCSTNTPGDYTASCAVLFPFGELWLMQLRLVVHVVLLYSCYFCCGPRYLKQKWWWWWWITMVNFLNHVQMIFEYYRCERWYLLAVDSSVLSLQSTVQWLKICTVRELYHSISVFSSYKELINLKFLFLL